MLSDLRPLTSDFRCPISDLWPPISDLRFIRQFDGFLKFFAKLVAGAVKLGAQATQGAHHVRQALAAEEHQHGQGNDHPFHGAVGPEEHRQMEWYWHTVHAVMLRQARA